ncbi:hypothetical protein M422DRAFT_36533 [Sphaerobolus stellatus SS14]|uniref:Sister chromatid cohesion protein n=1 Tax=Sphaerobolus stellatus (strain SS14) TaxID=990650 RepID=A0A0C9TL36_SPHS4|nr:hypothetical protein M422DRAFT_36533 [Sphaerobolus stellatus SS14]
MVAQTRGGVVSTSANKKLKFKEKLVGKSSSTDALLKKLQSLHQELAQMDQDAVDIKSLDKVEKDLVNVQLLLHKDKGVKAHTACCLADILRLTAPNAPYTRDELRDIFEFMFRQLLNGLKAPTSPYYQQYYHVLESLATVKSVVLVHDVQQGDELVTTIFDTLFKLVLHNLPRNTEICMRDILVALIEESQTSLPTAALEALVHQFKEKNTRMDQPAYRLAVEVCNAAVDHLQRYVGQYFTDMIVNHAKDEDFSEIRATHELIKKIHHDCPSLLYNIVPQLEEELKVDELEIRLLATQVLGEMFADKSGADLARKYPQVWEAWCNRKIDKSATVRVAFVEACKGIISTHQDLRGAVEAALKLKVIDPDDKVRAMACKVYSQLDYETALHHVSVAQLRYVSERCMDKKASVRKEAMNALGRLFSLARPEIEENIEAAITQFAWIPEAIVRAALAGTESKAQVEFIFFQYITPLPSKEDEDATWTDRLLLVMRHFTDERSLMTLMTLVGNMTLARPSPFEKYLEFCEEYNGGTTDGDETVVKRKLNLAIQHLSNVFFASEKAKVSEDLHTFADLNEQRLYKLLKTCLDTQTDVKALVKARSEFIRRTEQLSSSIVDTMASFIRKGSLWIINTSSIPSLLKHLQPNPNGDASEEEAYARCAKTALDYVCKHCPGVYKAHVGELVRALAVGETEGDEEGGKGNERLVEVALRGLAALGWEANDKRTKERLAKYVQSANVRHAKFAVRVIRHLKDAEEVAGRVVSVIAKSLPTAGEDLLVGHLAALAELVKHLPDAFEQKSEVIVAFIVKEVLMRNSEDAMEVDEDETLEEWSPDSGVSALTKAKLLSIKICRNRCIAHGKSEFAKDVGGPVIKILVAILQNNGAVKDDVVEDPTAKSRLRLLAATSLLQLASIPAYCEDIMPDFPLVALTIQDSCFQVRLGFLTKLVSYLSRKKTDPRFTVIVFLTAHDPEKEIREKAKGWVTMTAPRLTQELRVATFDMCFLRLIHMAAHHPDFGLEDANLKETAKYIEFYLDINANQENISFLYHLAMKVKTIRDIDDTYCEKLYCATELAQEVIKARAKHNGWGLQTYPGKVKLPGDIFKAMPNAEAAKKAIKKVYLPVDALTWINQLGKSVGSPNPKPRGRPRAAGNGEAKVGRKRKSSTSKSGGGATKKPPRKRRRGYDDDDDEEDDDDDDDDDDDEEDEDQEEIESFGEGESDGDDDDGGGGEEQIGRGARGRAKKRALREAKKQKKNGK